MNQIEQRITQLEKSVRNYRIFFGSAITVCIAVILMSSGKKAPVPDVVQAKAFEVVDKYGHVIARLHNDEGDGSLTTYSSTGKKLVNLFTSDGGGGGLNTFDNDGEVNFKITRTTDGGGYMALFNADRKEIFEVGSTTINSGYLKVNDQYGEKLAWLTFTEGGGAYFSLMGKNNKEYLKFSTPEAGGRVGIYNNYNNRIAFLGTQDNHDGNLTLYNSGGTYTGSLPK